MEFVNLTPHDVILNDGTTFPKSGMVARVSSAYSDFDTDGVCTVVFGDITGLPHPEPGVTYIVSGMVAAAAKDRTDVVAPATGHPLCVRNDKGQIVSVPGFVKG